jgi:hypothetical protein
VLSGCEVDDHILTLELAGDDRGILEWGDYEIDTGLRKGVAARPLGWSVDWRYDRDSMSGFDRKGGEAAADETRATGKENPHRLCRACLW